MVNWIGIITTSTDDDDEDDGRPARASSREEAETWLRVGWSTMVGHEMMIVIDCQWFNNWSAILLVCRRYLEDWKLLPVVVSAVEAKERSIPRQSSSNSQETVRGAELWFFRELKANPIRSYLHVILALSLLNMRVADLETEMVILGSKMKVFLTMLYRVLKWEQL